MSAETPPGTEPSTEPDTAALPAAARPAAKSGRRRAREFALQGLYQWLLSQAGTPEIVAHLRETTELGDFSKSDRAHFDALLHGCIDSGASLDAALARHIDRPAAQLSPVEHAVLMIGAYELQHCLEVPYRVAINEAVELAKAFGGTDGHKYVNGVLDRVAADLRPEEVAKARAGRHGGTGRPRG